MTYHYPPKGQSLIGVHRNSSDCPCHPQKLTKRKLSSSGAYGRSQGYKTEISYQHNYLEEK